MKKIKSILSIVLAIALVLCSVMVPVSATVTTPTDPGSGDPIFQLTSATGKPGEAVTLSLSIWQAPNNIGVWQCNVWVPEELGTGTIVETGYVTDWDDQNLAADPGCFSVFYLSIDETITHDINGTVCTVTYTIPEDAAVGTVYELTPAVIGEEVFLADNQENILENVTMEAATITVVGDEPSGDIELPTPTVPTDPGSGNPIFQLTSATGKPGEAVTLSLSIWQAPNNIGVWQCNVWVPEELGTGTIVETGYVTDWDDQNLAADPGCFSVFYLSIDETITHDINGTVCTVTYTIPEDATVGTVYELTPAVIGEEVFLADNQENILENVTMATANIVVVGDEVTPPAPTEYNVTVNGGTSDVAKAEEGATVTITAAAPATGMVFDKWTVVGGGVTLANANSASTTFTMGTADVEVTATYKAMEVDVYVTNGTATGTAAYGQTITITADAAPTGKTFDKWVVTSGGVTLANANAATTTFTMGTEAVQVQATYKNVNYTVSEGSATGGTVAVAPTTAVYGETVTVTVSPATGKKLATLYYIAEGTSAQVAINTALKTFTMPAANVTVYATFADITGITITGDYRGEAGDEIYTGDTNVTVDFTVSDNSESIAGITFTLDIEAGLTTGAVTFTPAEGLEILASEGNSYTVWSAYAATDMTAESFKLGTVTVSTVTAKSSTVDTQYKVSMTVDSFMVSDGNADAVDATVVDGTVYVSKTVASIKFYDKSNNYSEFTAIEVDETVADKDGYVADYINTNVAYKITYTDGTTDADYTDATADMFADLTTDVTDSMVGGDQATITGTYTQTATNTPVSADVAVSIALNETIVDMTVVPETLYFKLGDTFAWGNTQYTLIQANSGTVGPNAVSAGILAGTLTDNSAALDNTSTAKQTVTVTYAADTTITDTVDVYFVAATIENHTATTVYYEEGATFAASNNNISIVVSYDEARTGIANETITTGIDVTAPAMTLATNAIATAQDVVISYNGSADYTLDDVVVVVDFAEFGKVLVKGLTADATVTELLKLSNYGTDLVTTDLIAVRNIAIRKA